MSLRMFKWDAAAASYLFVRLWQLPAHTAWYTVDIACSVVRTALCRNCAMHMPFACVFLQNMRIMILKCVFICYSKSAITEVAVKVLNIVDFVLWLLELFGFIKSVIVEQLRSSCCASLSSQQLRSAGFFCGQPCDMELVTRQSERPGHQQTGVHWRRFYFQLTCVHSTLELSGLCALQI